MLLIMSKIRLITLKEKLYILDTHFENYFGDSMEKFYRVVHCIKNSQGWLIREGAYKENSKFLKNGFGSLDLAKYLVELNEKERIDCIEVLGLCTDIVLLQMYFY